MELPGQGTLHDASQGKFIGVFSFGSLDGEGEHFSKEGNYYKGQFNFGQYQGKGRLKYKNGDVYEGGFNYGRYSGQGKIVYAEPKDGISSRSGTWNFGELVESDDGKPFNSASSLNEIALYNQSELIEETHSKIDTNDPNKIDLYFLGISGDGTQAVFRREIQFVESLFKEKFNTTGKSAVLINSRDTVKEVPLATNTSIQKTIGYLANKMDLEQDILFVYMTSHGSKKATFKLEQSGLSLPELSAKSLAETLKTTGIKRKVVVVSACYSGLFIPELQDDHSLIITASAEDKTSFGCSDEAEFTYFGDAFFNQALNETNDFVEAYELAVSYVKTKEQAKDYKSSDPQIHAPKAIVDYLGQWRDEN
ncbi:MAG: caspase family protein [Kangiellaceae bacterium]|nr:caspase family protein [Kangiellaceae bacterium]